MFQGMHYIYEVYKEKSFSKAAKNLYISQPSLSAAVKKTEQRIGAPIFDRSSNPIQLTDCGKEYINCIEKIMDIQNEFENYMGDLQELRTGSLSIGASNLFASYILPSCISRFTLQFPQISIHLAEADTPFLTDQLSNGQLDLIIDNEELSPEIYAKYPLFSDHLLLAVPVKHLPSAQKTPEYLTVPDILQDRHKATSYPAVDLHLFEHAPFLLLRSGNDTRHRADLLCRKQKFTPNVILELDQQATSYHLSCYGMGITFVSDILIKKAPPCSDVVFFHLDDSISFRSVCFYRKKGRYVTRAMEIFLDMAAEIISFS